MLIAIKSTKLKHKNKTVLVEQWEKLNITTLEENTITLFSEIKGHKQWTINPQDWTITDKRHGQVHPEWIINP